MGIFSRNKVVKSEVKKPEKIIDIGFTLEGEKYFEYSLRNGSADSQTRRRADRMRIVVEKELDPNFFKCKVYFYKQGNKDDFLVNTMYVEFDIGMMNDNNPQYVSDIFNKLLGEFNEILTDQESKKSKIEGSMNNSIPQGHVK